jgi:hypothetical protein
MRKNALIVAALAACGAAAASAEDKVYRCGQTYQQVPCAQGEVIDASDKRTEAQRHDANAAAKAEKQQAKDLEAERHQREKALKPQTEPVAIGAEPVEPAASDSFATPPGHPRKKKTKPGPGDPKYMAPPALNGGR